MKDFKNRDVEETFFNTLKFLSNEDLRNLLTYALKLKNDDFLGFLFEEEKFEQSKKQTNYGIISII